MQVILLIAVTLGIIGALGFLSLSSMQLGALIGGSLLLLLITKSISFWLALIIGLATLAFLGISNYASFRQKTFTKPLFHWFKRVLPPISETEQIAIEAGSVWWDKDLFSGNPDWEKLLAIPQPSMTEEEQAFLDGPTEELCAMLDDWQITGELYDLPEPIWDFLKKHKFLGMIVPKEYGGLGFSALANSNVVMKIASRSTTAAVTVMVPNSLGPAELLVHYGTQDQRDHYLPKLAVGEEIPCFALTAPSAGSDAGAIPDKGIVCYGEHEGKKVLGLKVTWNKRYITLGPIATVLGLAFKAYDPDNLVGDTEELGITCALIPTSTPGVNIGRRHMPLNIPFMNGPNSGDDVFIPMDWIIGKEQGLGDGWRMLMGCLAAGRAISLPALGTAAGKYCARFTGAYSRIRKQFRLPIGKFEGVEEALARIAGYSYIMDAGRIMTAGSIDLGEKPTVLSAILKYHNTELMRTAVNDAMDILGGKGICLGPKNFLGRCYQAIPISITVEGANILTRSMMIYGQGAFRCHPYILDEMSAVANPDEREGLLAFDKALMGHVRYAVRNFTRAFCLGLTGGYLAKTPKSGPTAKYYRDLSRFSAAFTALSDLSMLIMGGSLKRKEKLSGRLGDCLSYLYYGSAILKHYHDSDSPAEDLPLVHWSMQYCLYQIQQAMLGVLQNYPIPAIGIAFKWLAFPLGARFKLPSDKLGHEIGKMLLSSNASRDRLTSNIYINDRPDDSTGSIEHALGLVIAAAPIERELYQNANKFVYQTEADAAGLQQAVDDGIISAEEADLIKRAAVATANVINVDDFASEAMSNTLTNPSSDTDGTSKAA